MATTATGEVSAITSGPDLAFIAAACWRTMLLRRLDTRSGGVTWPAD
jgi:hypothetical protein